MLICNNRAYQTQYLHDHYTPYQWLTDDTQDDVRLKSMRVSKRLTA